MQRARSTAASAAGAIAGYELFEDVNSYSKAFGELVERAGTRLRCGRRCRRR
jgi:hypothetical protein